MNAAGLRAWLGLLVCAATPASARAGIAFVQDAAANGAGNPYVLSFPSEPTPGDTLIAAVLLGVDAGALGVMDGCGRSFTTAIGPTLILQNGYTQQVLYTLVEPCDAGAFIQYTTDYVGYVEVIQTEYAGISSASPLDGTSTLSGGASPAQSGVVMTHAGGELLFSWVVASSLVTDAGVGFIPRVEFHGDLVEDAIAGAPGAYDATAETNSGWAVQLVAFSPSVDGGVDAGLVDAGALDGGRADSGAPDAGTDGGAKLSAQTDYRIGWGCNAGSSPPFALALLWLAARFRKKR